MPYKVLALIVDVTLDNIDQKQEGKIMNKGKLLVGIDVGCRTHHVAIGENEGIAEEFQITHDFQGFQHLFTQIANQQKRQKLTEVIIGMEGTNGYARPLDQLIKQKRYTLLNVNNLKLARFKEIFATPAKTDNLDAKTILLMMKMAPQMEQIKESLQEVYDIEKTEQQLKKISRRRRQLTNEKVVIQNRMQADLQAVCPGLLDTIKQVDANYVLKFLSSQKDLKKLAKIRPEKLQKIRGIGKGNAAKLSKWQSTAIFGLEIDWVGPMICEDAKRILELKKSITELEKQMEKLVQESRLAKLLKSIPGFGTVCAAEVAGEIGNIERFKSEAGLAIYLGLAPLDNSSGNYHGTKSPKQVNKRAKAAMIVAMSHNIRYVERSKTYYDKKRSEGKKHNQALRSLGRHMVRVIWSMIKNDCTYEHRLGVKAA